LDKKRLILRKILAFGATRIAPNIIKSGSKFSCGALEKWLVVGPWLVALGVG